MKDTTSGFAGQEETLKEISGEIRELAPHLFSGDRVDFSAYMKKFGSLLPQWVEYSISPSDKSLGIMTRGVGSDFEEEVRAYLEESGMDNSVLKNFDRVRKYFPDVSILAKRDFHEEEAFKFTVYWQHLLPINHLLRLARQYRFNPEVLEFFSEASLLLRGKAVNIGMGFIPPDRVSLKVFFANPLRKSASYIAPGLAALMSKMGLSAEAVNYFIGFHNFLFPVASGSVFTSLGFGENPPRGLKLDYEIIPMEHALQMVEALGFGPGQKDRLKETMESLMMKRITYVGIKFSPGRKASLKFYFDRRFSEKNQENPEVLADFLRNSIWTP